MSIQSHKMKSLLPFPKVLISEPSEKSTRYIPPEVLKMIISHIHNPATLRNLSQTSRICRSIALLSLKRDTLTLDTAERLFDWLNQHWYDAYRKTNYKYLELKFDLKWFRKTPELYTKISNRKGYIDYLPLKGLETVKLITTGYNFIVDEDRKLHRYHSKEEGNYVYERPIITLHECLSRLLSLMVDEDGPRHFTRIDGNNHLTKKYNRIRSNSSKYHNYPQTPPVLHLWRNTITWKLPYLVRPTWPYPRYEDGIKSPIRLISVPASGLHKYVKGFTWEYLVQDLVLRNGREKVDTIIEIRGKLPKGKEIYIEGLNEILAKVDRKGLIKLVWVDKGEGLGQTERFDL